MGWGSVGIDGWMDVSWMEFFFFAILGGLFDLYVS
jgi:hypothetical protein